MKSKAQRRAERRGEIEATRDLGSDPDGDPGSDPDRDPAGDLDGDPDREPEVGSGDVEVWFDAEELARASSIELGVERSDGDQRQAKDPQHALGTAPSPAQLLAALAHPSVSIATLPGWPGAGPAGQGLGLAAAEMIGELRPGQLVVWTGLERAVGRSSLLAQLGDGLALRRQPGQPLTPVVWVSERPAAIWRARSVARWSGLAPETFLDPGRARAQSALAALLESFERGTWAQLGVHQRFIRRADFVGEARERAASELFRWREELAQAAEIDAAEVWPIVIVDPVEMLDGALPEVLAQLAELARSEACIVFASCDEPEDRLSSRELDRHTHARVCVHRMAEGTELELVHSPLARRHRVRLAFETSCGRLSCTQ